MVRLFPALGVHRSKCCLGWGLFLNRSSYVCRNFEFNLIGVNTFI